jgi:hypothetical protein
MLSTQEVRSWPIWTIVRRRAPSSASAHFASQWDSARVAHRRSPRRTWSNPLHFEPDFAKRTRFGRLVAQGGITAGMLNALVAMDLPGPGTVFMNQSLRYLAPTYLGDGTYPPLPE